MKKEGIFLPPFGAKKKIVVIGGGATGSLSALELARAGHDVTLIEAGQIGNGSSSRSAACIRQQFGNESTVKGMIFANRYYDNWDQITGAPTSPIVHSGYLWLHGWTKTDLDSLKELVKKQKEAGLQEVEILDPTEIGLRFPYIETTGVLAATWCPTDGFLSPEKVYLDATESLRNIGGTIVIKDEVVEVITSNDLPVSVRTKSGKIFDADIFINTAGVWAPKVSTLFGGQQLNINALKRYLYFIKGFNGNPKGKDQIMTEEDLDKLPMVIMPEGCYCRPESKGSGRIMSGWVQFTRPIEPSFENQDHIEPGFGKDNFTDYGWALRKTLTAYIPDIQHMGTIYSVISGLYEDTPDHNPLIGFDPKIPNLIHCAGFSGHGLMHAPFSAHIVSHLVSTGRNIEQIPLPFNLGPVDVKTFWVDRVFLHPEGMVI
jgi:glycine/D-amino acid oxidase-like deaminating enzyme